VILWSAPSPLDLNPKNTTPLPEIRERGLFFKVHGKHLASLLNDRKIP
jgi:hypothetical protein